LDKDTCLLRVSWTSITTELAMLMIAKRRWPTPNYIDPIRRGPAAVNVTIVFICLVSIAVFLRVYIHIFVIRWFGPGDIFIILAYVSLYAG
jgi:hypothetical protein